MEREHEFVGQITTDWLDGGLAREGTAEAKAPQRPPRSLPATSPRPKSSKSCRRQVDPERVSHVDWGRKMPDKDAGKPVPKPVNLKDQVVPYIQGNWGRDPQAHPDRHHPAPRR